MCLHAERTALTKRDMSALEQTTQNKLKYTQKLEKLEQQREQLVAGLGFGSDAASLKCCFESLPQTDALTRLWQQVLANVDACRDGNLTNGSILEAGRRHVEQALLILRGQGQAGSSSVYSSNGDRPANLSQRELGKV
jgi:flagellar biosynthesis/type III secretory pathway chaperone